MREEEKTFKERNVRIVVVTFEAGHFARRYIDETDLPWPVLVDENRELYQAYDMLTASFWDIWGPKTWWAYLKAILHGQKLQKSHGEISQRGGDVLIDPEGIIRLHHVGEGPADRPSVASILEKLTR
ncbi:MAG: redoxin domain-containing protein [Proteobacteria bacterium]|nr:redoxin domain-containing protein [Pseudomonadota bacterium]